MIALRRARPSDAVAIGAVHVAAWRSAYPGVLPDDYLSRLSVTRQARHYQAMIQGGSSVHVAASTDTGPHTTAEPRVVGFVTGGVGRGAVIAGKRLGEAEIETLYVLDDFRDCGLGRGLMRAAAMDLAEAGRKSVFLWVLRENPSRWFYEHLGGRQVAEATILVGGRSVVQTAFAWDPIEKLVQATSRAS